MRKHIFVVVQKGGQLNEARKDIRVLEEISTIDKLSIVNKVNGNEKKANMVEY